MRSAFAANTFSPPWEKVAEGRLRGALGYAVAALLALLLALFITVLPAAATEEIRVYYTAITVLPNRSVDVTETITVNSEGIKIIHGMFREVGRLHIVNADGSRRNARLTIMSVLRDGEPEPYRLEDHGHEVAVYMGDADVLLPPGVHVYALRYRMSDATASLDGSNVLQWQVIDAGWPFAIQKTTASVTLPDDASIENLTAGIGAATGKDAGRWASKSANKASFVAARPVGASDGLVVTVTFDGGLAPSRKLDQPS